MGYLGIVNIDGTSHKVGSTLFGTCATEAATAAKVVTCSDFTELPTGVTIHVKFTYSNTAANPTLNINSKGAKSIYRYGTTVPGTTAETSWNAGAVVSFTYDGSSFIMNDWVNTNTNTDTNVTQTATNTNANYEVLFSGTADNTTRTEGARKYSNLTFNPSTGTLTTTKVVASTATLGVADIDTANITEDNVGNLIVTGAARFLNTINGSISGNAEKLNGYASDTAATNNTIARRTANGYIFATYFNQSSGAETPTSSSYMIYANSDGYFRKSTVANMKTAMSLNNVENKSSATIRGELTSANVTTALGYTPANKAGDTFTGRVAYKNVSMPLSAGKVTSLAAGTTEIFKDGIAISNPATANDVGWIRVTGTGEADTVLEIATGDDGGMTNCEKTVVRQYNTSNAVAREAVLLNTDGTSSFPVSVTAPKFIGNLQGTADNSDKVDGYHIYYDRYVSNTQLAQPTADTIWYVKVSTANWNSNIEVIQIRTGGNNRTGSHVLYTGSRGTKWWGYGQVYSHRGLSGVYKVISNSDDIYLRFDTDCTSATIYTSFTPQTLAIVDSPSGANYTEVPTYGGWYGNQITVDHIQTNNYITIQKQTVASNTFADTNPKIVFKNVDGSQNGSLTWCDYDSVQYPASLTLNGNQGEEYFIAPNIKATGSFYGTLSGHASLDLALTGGTMTGQIISNHNQAASWLNCGKYPDIHINNTGASGWIGGNTKTGRHVICTYASNDDLLYFNWYSNTTLEGTENKVDKQFTWNPATNTLTTNISGNAATATTAQYVSLIASNEIRFANKPSSAVDVYFNYQWADGTASAMINKYVFMNGNKTKCPVEASKFIGPLQGNADTATTATNTNYLISNSRMDYGWNGVNYFNQSANAGNGVKVNDNPTTAWWHIMRFNHGNNAGYYTDLAVPFNDVSLYYKRISNGALQNGGWVQVCDALNSGFVYTNTVKYYPHTRKFQVSKSTSAWDAQAYSTDGYVDNIMLSFKPNQTNMAMMIGFDSNPSQDANYANIDYALYCMNNGKVSIYESGTERGVGSPTYVAGDEFRIEYSGGYVRYYHNGTLLREIARAVSGKLYMDSSFHGATSCIYDVSYGIATRNATYALSATNATTATKANSLATEVGTSAGARPVWYSYLGDNTRAVYDTAFTYNPSGGVLTATKFSGAIATPNNTYNNIGDDAAIGDINVAGTLGIKGLNGTTGIQLVPYSGSTAQKISINGSGTMTITGTVASTFSGNLTGNADSATLLNQDTAYKEGTAYVCQTSAGTVKAFCTRANNSNIGVSTQTYGCMLLSATWGGGTSYNGELFMGMGDFPNLYFRGKNNGTYTAWKAIGQFTATPTSGQVVITDGTTGGMKSSGYTIAKSVPSDAKFTDTNYYHTTGSWSGLTYTATANGGAGALAFTIPTGTSATTVAVGNHTHSYLKAEGVTTQFQFINSSDVTTWTQDALAATNSIAYMQNAPSGAPISNHGVWFNVKAMGTPFQLYIPDHNQRYIYKRYWVSANSAYSDWFKLSAGYADSAGTANTATSATKATQDSDGNTINSTYLKLSGGTLTGNLAVTNVLGINASNGSSGGISLYAGTNYVDDYGICFRTTSNKGKHGYVTSDWATYFTMSNTNNRGWVFRRNGVGNVASIDTSGQMVLNGSLTIGGNAANTSGCRLVYSELGSVDFVFV